MQQFRRILHSVMKFFNHWHLCRFHVEHLPNISTRSFCTIWAGSWIRIARLKPYWKSLKLDSEKMSSTFQLFHVAVLENARRKCCKAGVVRTGRLSFLNQPVDWGRFRLFSPICYFTSILFKISILSPFFSFFPFAEKPTHSAVGSSWNVLQPNCRTSQCRISIAWHTVHLKLVHKLFARCLSRLIKANLFYSTFFLRFRTSLAKVESSTRVFWPQN